MPATTPHRLPRRRLAAVAAVAAVPLLSACSTFSPATTAVPYNASDGVSVQLGQLEAANLLVVGSEKGGQGVLSGGLVNTGADDLTVAISTQGAPTPVTVTVPGHRMVSLTADNATPASGGAPSTTATVLVPSLPVAPGANVTVQLATRAGGQTQVIVPVLPPVNEYATITAPPTPTATATQSPSASPSESPTASPSSSESAQPTTSPS